MARFATVDEIRARLPKATATLSLLAVAATVSACGSADATPAAKAAPPPAATTAVAPPPPSVATTGNAPIDRFTAVARKRYDDEVAGTAVHTQLRRVSQDPVLQRLLQSGDVPALRAYVRRQFKQVWYHWHVSRMRITRGSRVLIEVGVPFALATSQQTFRDAGGGARGTLQISVQDEIGIVRFMHRHYPVDVVVRGQGGHVATLLPAAARAKLPARGPVTLAGRRYLVRSFSRTAFGGEPVTVWVLMRG